MEFDNYYRGLPDPLPVPVTEGKKGPWFIQTFELTDAAIGLSNLRAVRDGHLEMLVKPGTYTGLYHKQRGVVMSNTPMEVRTNQPIIENATGHVLINGLGLGMCLLAVLQKPEVKYVKVMEIDSDVIELVGKAPVLRHEMEQGRLVIVQGDALTYEPFKGEKYDAAWHDIWDTIGADNLAEMTALKRKWARRVQWQGCWSQEMAQRERRRYG